MLRFDTSGQQIVQETERKYSERAIAMLLLQNLCIKHTILLQILNIRISI